MAQTPEAVLRHRREILVRAVTALAKIGVPVTAGCVLVGLARSTYYRISRDYRHYRRVQAPTPHAQRCQPAALTSEEKAEAFAVLTDEQFVDCSVLQTYWRAFDQGRLRCSQRSFYRIATAHKLVGDRRRRRYGGSGSVSRRKPIVGADYPNHLWSWDVTELRGPGRQRYKLAVVIDVHSRYPVAWHLDYHEDRKALIAMFTEAFARHATPAMVHADNGSIMRSHDLAAAFETHKVGASFSRPRVSDDNPFSESLFKTIKYELSCPTVFDSLEHARQWTSEYLTAYATEHRHSGIGFHTPESAYTGTAAAVQARRQQRLDELHTANPNRYRRGRPQAPELPGPTGINIKKPSKPNETNNDLSQTG